MATSDPSWYLDEAPNLGWLEVDLRKLESFNTVSLVGAVWANG